jgi:hypothetical protein
MVDWLGGYHFWNFEAKTHDDKDTKVCFGTCYSFD